MSIRAGVVVTNFRGRLGNQMFQHACGRALAEQQGVPLRVALDVISAPLIDGQPELYRVFKPDSKPAVPSELAYCIGVWRIPGWMRCVLAQPAFARFRGPRFHTESLARARPNSAGPFRAYLHGYWQSERFFFEHAAAVRRDFAFPTAPTGRNAELAQWIVQGPAASLHVRRGDYATDARTQAFHGLCGVNYYVAAVQRLRQLEPSLRILAFSDDPAWAAEALHPVIQQMTIVTHNTGTQSFEDMRLMSLCRHHVIANSSFSWWAAWLNPQPDKIVIAPRRWFADGRDDADLVPSSWQRL